MRASSETASAATRMVRPAGWTGSQRPVRSQALQAEERGDGEEGLHRGRAGVTRPGPGDGLADEAGELDADDQEEGEVEPLHAPADAGEGALRVPPPGALRRRGGADGDEV